MDESHVGLQAPLEPGALPPEMERRMRLFMLLLIAAGTIAGSALAGLNMGLGIALGGALSMFNERWLSSSTRAIVEFASSTGNPSVPRAARFILRLFVIAAVICLASWSGYFNLLGVGIGFTAFVGAAMLEGVWQALHHKP